MGGALGQGRSQGPARVQAGAEGQWQCLRGCPGEDVGGGMLPEHVLAGALLGFTL